jgi:hypothetical protein
MVGQLTEQQEDENQWINVLARRCIATWQTEGHGYYLTRPGGQRVYRGDLPSEYLEVHAQELARQADSILRQLAYELVPYPMEFMRLWIDSDEGDHAVNLHNRFSLQTDRRAFYANLYGNDMSREVAVYINSMFFVMLNDGTITVRSVTARSMPYARG